MEPTKNDIEEIKKFRKSPIHFIFRMWGLVPQPLKKEYVGPIQELSPNYDEYKASWFEPFQKGHHITWQQWLVLLAVEDVINKKTDKVKISVRSGHGIGKSTTLSWLIFWYLFCFKDAQIPCTAPTSEQMYDVLWKELSAWKERLPEGIKELFDITANYVRISESPNTWFARAKTARKEKPEALAGIHSDYVMMVVDEASGVPEEVYNTGEGALTGENVIVILISNPTRLIGTFYDSQKETNEEYTRLALNSEDSPIVDQKYIDRIIAKHGIDSDEYRIRVIGEFPKEDSLDDQGYVALLDEKDISETTDETFIGKIRLGVDPSGQGSDKTSWVVRDKFRAMVAGQEAISNEKSIAQKSLTLMDKFKTAPEDVYIDNFGKGANVAQEIAVVVNKTVKAINVGEPPLDKELYTNRKAEATWRAKQWLRQGGEIVRHEGFKKEALTIRVRKELNGKMKVMGKRDMKKAGFPSPNHWDAFVMTFMDEDKSNIKRKRIKRKVKNSIIGI